MENGILNISDEALYYRALFVAFKEFIEEEKDRQCFTELRLMKKIEAARTIYKKPRKG